MFAELLSMLHSHWPSRRPASANCAVPVQVGDEGCSQSVDPSAPFYAAQSNLVSYEPLLVRALEDERLGDMLYRANSRLKTLSAGGRNGVQVLSDFVTRMLTVDPELSYRGGRKYSHTNTCKPVESAADRRQRQGDVRQRSWPRHRGRDAHLPPARCLEGLR